MIKVLIVNHEEELMLLIKKYLERDFYEATFSDNLDELILKARKFMPDVFLIDAPQKQFIKNIKNDLSLAAIPVLMMTAQTTSSDDITSNVNDTIQKPFEGVVLKNKLKLLANQFGVRN